MKKVLISGYIGFNNFGDDLIFYILSRHLKSLNFEVQALANNKKEVRKNYKIKTYDYKNFFSIIKAVSFCDILISGGGSLLQNKTSNKSLFYYLFIIILAKILFKKVIIFSQGIEPPKGKFIEFFLKTVLKTTDFITVRDEKSMELLNKWKIKSTLVSDATYEIIDEKEIIQEKKGLVVQLRKTANTNETLLNNLADIIKDNYRGEITVLSLHRDYDEKTCLNFIEKLEKRGFKTSYNSYYLNNKNNMDEIINLLNSAKFIISERLHGLILANAFKAHCFALSYDEKIKTLCDEMNISYIDIKNYTLEELNSKLKIFFNDKKEAIQYRKFFWDCIDNNLKTGDI